MLFQTGIEKMYITSLPAIIGIASASNTIGFTAITRSQRFHRPLRHDWHHEL
ncbi:hypothetical protein NG798_25685 [Ancylothrix sp. C2]|uniref:hypothetical protein n=1 Tax=Ancylothrix sp. D3o TaxID=2953691 RepID=UPI0021BAB931|nr:hypothetical protein [Ancylothrix sp. D3o]MCT7953193.1 hypothetical protein [Ancylothrix sp. D3o]